MNTRTDQSVAAAVAACRDRKALGPLPVWRQVVARQLRLRTAIATLVLAALSCQTPAAGKDGNSPSSGIRLLDCVIDTSAVVAKSKQTGRHADKISAEAPTRKQGLSSRGTRLYIVQLSGPVREDWKTALRAAGADIKGYVPENAFIVEADPGKLDHIGQIESVQWIGEYQADYKVQPRLKSLFNNRAPGKTRSTKESVDVTPGITVVTITTFTPDDVDRVGQAVAGVGGQVLRTAKGKRRGLVRAQIAIEAVEALSALGTVEWIEEYVPHVLHNNVATEAPRMNVSVVWTNYGLTGTGQVVGIADTGLDTGSLVTIHPDFTNRVRATFALGRTGDWSDPDGHGTHTAGSILGNGSAYSNGLFHGAAYGAQLVFQSILDSGGGLGGLPADLNTLFLQAYTNGARVHSDSWGAPLNGYYSTDCENTDEFIWNHPDMLVVFSAGNDGRDGPRDGVVDLHRMGAPGTSKNVLTVGASESQRPAGSGGYSSYAWGIGSWGYYYPVPPISTDLISTSADGINQGMAAFSSRGPCNDGRFKPDIVAPGTDIISCRSRAPGADSGWGTGSGVLGNSASNYYVFMGGTSMSTPLTAGAAALARQYLVELRGITNPCAALVKAALINGARSLTPGQYGTGTTREVPPAPRPNNVEGWGQVNLAASLFSSTGCTNVFYDATNSLATGSTNTHTFEVSSTNRLSITLAWTDYPATLSAATKLVNDLDLLVILPSGATNYASGRSDFDRINNVEGLDLDPAPQGMLTIKVIGYNIPSGPQPYALVLRTSATSSLAKATGPAPALAETEVSRNTRLSWGNAGGATEFNLYFGTNASPGPSEFVGTQEATWLSPGSLDYRKTYYWRVDALNPGGTLTGDVWSFITEAPVVFSEGFENGGVIPAGWTHTHTAGTRDWSFIGGGYPVWYSPSAAHGGSYNACLYANSYTDRTMLISPPINFGVYGNNPELTFWHCMEDWNGDQDYLRVYYRTNATAGWTTLSNYLSCTTPWTKRTLSLPAPSTNYYIAFEGDANYGFGVCIDDVEATGMLNDPPAITTQPVSQTNNPGSSAHFTVVASGTAPLYYQWQKETANIGAAAGATYTIGSVGAGDAGNYRCLVSNMAGIATSAAATLAVTGPAVIIGNPQSQTNNPGSSASFSVTATGTAPLYYQWQKEAANIGGATNAFYTIDSVVAGDAGNYRCLASNMLGIVTSTVATLAVTVPPVMTTSPQSLIRNVGETASFIVSATGTAPLNYQWQKNGAVLGGATGTAYTIAVLAVSDAGNYRCLASNMAGMATSTVAVLTVNTVTPTNPPPSAPTGVSASDGTFTSKVQVTWNASGGATRYEVWQHTNNSSRSASKISSPDPTGTSYDDTRTTAGKTYYYWVKAVNAAGASGFSIGNSGWRAGSKADLAMVDHAGTWYIWFSSTSYQMDGPFFLGASGTPIAADFDGDRHADPAMQAMDNWYIWFSSTGYQMDGPFYLGVSGTPVAADFDGDGKADLAMVDNAADWYIWFSSTSYQMDGPFYLGVSGTPVAADFDGDGKADLAMVDNAANWYIWFSSMGYQIFGPTALGMSGTPVAADFDGQ